MMLSLISLVSCGKEEITKETREEIRKEVKAETINGETTVTISTTKDGKEEVKTLTGEEAKDYMAMNDLTGDENPNGSEIIIKKIENSSSLDIDVDEILSDPALVDIDDATKEKVKKALENSLSDIELDIDFDNSTDSKVKTKVIVIDEEKSE